MKFSRILKAVALSVTALSCFAIIGYFDHRTVKLEYAGKVRMDPPISYYRQKAKYYFFLSNGKNFREKMEKKLLPLRGKQIYRLEWDNFVIDEDALYCICVGCEVDNITYYYHTKYTNNYDIPSLFIIDSVSLKPLSDKSIITIYKRDVPLAHVDL